MQMHYTDSMHLLISISSPSCGPHGRGPPMVVRGLTQTYSEAILKLNPRIFISILVCLFLSGCHAFWSVQDASPGFDNRRLTRPSVILPNQKAYVYGRGFYVDALRETGLFASVEATSSRQPPATGVYIAFEDGDRYENTRDNSGAMGTLANLMTLGLIPDPSVRAWDATYYISVYQNGAPLIKSKSVQMLQHEMAGWVALGIDEKETWRGEARLLVSRMIDGLNRGQ